MDGKATTKIISTVDDYRFGRFRFSFETLQNYEENGQKLIAVPSKENFEGVMSWDKETFRLCGKNFDKKTSCDNR